jgi:hypothetical protein
MTLENVHYTAKALLSRFFVVFFGAMVSLALTATVHAGQVQFQNASSARGRRRRSPPLPHELSAGGAGRPPPQDRGNTMA